MNWTSSTLKTFMLQIPFGKLPRTQVAVTLTQAYQSPVPVATLSRLHREAVSSFPWGGGCSRHFLSKPPRAVRPLILRLPCFHCESSPSPCPPVASPWGPAQLPSRGLSVSPKSWAWWWRGDRPSTFGAPPLEDMWSKGGRDGVGGGVPFQAPTRLQ